MSMRSPAGFISAFFDPLKNPNAPTIGTATAGDASASVAFTAPANPGGSAITSYRVVASPGGASGASASSPTTVTGLTNGTAYTFQASATNSFGQSVSSASSNSVTPAPLAIGQAYGGGYYAGQIGVSGVATHYLVVGPVASAQSTLQWKTTNTSTAGTSSVIDGPTNSANMNNASHPAGQFCEAVTAGGQTDWYMPAKNELEVCYYNLKPTTTANNTSSGINANAVPARASNYTSGTPAQTSATDFKDTGAEDFVAAYYWSSTEYSAANAWMQYFFIGSQSGTSKDYSQGRVRAVRRVPV